MKKKLKRRNAVESVFGHTKADGKLDRNCWAETLADKIKIQMT